MLFFWLPRAEQTAWNLTRVFLLFLVVFFLAVHSFARLEQRWISESEWKDENVLYNENLYIFHSLSSAAVPRWLSPYHTGLKRLFERARRDSMELESALVSPHAKGEISIWKMFIFLSKTLYSLMIQLNRETLTAIYLTFIPLLSSFLLKIVWSTRKIRRNFVICGEWNCYGTQRR